MVLPEPDRELGLTVLAAGHGLVLNPGEAGQLLQLVLQALVLPRQLLQTILSVLQLGLDVKQGVDILRF